MMCSQIELGSNEVAEYKLGEPATECSGRGWRTLSVKSARSNLFLDQ